jgi:hypothetical protein
MRTAAGFTEFMRTAGPTRSWALPNAAVGFGCGSSQRLASLGRRASCAPPGGVAVRASGADGGGEQRDAPGLTSEMRAALTPTSTCSDAVARARRTLRLELRPVRGWLLWVVGPGCTLC